MDTRELLTSALRSVPQDFALREVRFYIQQALRSYEHVERRRAKRETQKTEYQRYRERQQQFLVNPLSAQDTLSTIDDMLAQEQAKLDKIETKRKTKDAGNQTLLD